MNWLPAIVTMLLCGAWTWLMCALMLGKRREHQTSRDEIMADHIRRNVNNILE